MRVTNLEQAEGRHTHRVFQGEGKIWGKRAVIDFAELPRYGQPSQKGLKT